MARSTFTREREPCRVYASGKTCNYGKNCRHFHDEELHAANQKKMIASKYKKLPRVYLHSTQGSDGEGVSTQHLNSNNQKGKQPETTETQPIHLDSSQGDQPLLIPFHLDSISTPINLPTSSSVTRGPQETVPCMAKEIIVAGAASQAAIMEAPPITYHTKPPCIITASYGVVTVQSLAMSLAQPHRNRISDEQALQGFICSNIKEGFPLFGLLPMELRTKVWMYFLKNPYFPEIEVYENKNGRKLVNRAWSPTALRTCHELRVLGLAHYSLCFGTTTSPPRTYFNYIYDGVFFNTRRFSDLPLILDLAPVDLANIRHMKLKVLDFAMALDNEWNGMIWKFQSLRSIMLAISFREEDAEWAQPGIRLTCKEVMREGGKPNWKVPKVRFMFEESLEPWLPEHGEKMAAKPVVEHDGPVYHPQNETERKYPGFARPPSQGPYANEPSAQRPCFPPGLFPAPFRW